MEKVHSETRGRILRAALRQFADCGYAGASVQAIVDAARVTKPVLYYYFKSKAGLYQALINWAHDERFRLMQEASDRAGAELADQLVEILAALFEFINDNRPLMRIAFATAFAAQNEIPPEIRYMEKCDRNFCFVHDLIRTARVAGTLNPALTSHDLAMGIYGMMTIKVMEHLVRGEPRLTRAHAESIVRLYLNGARGRAMPATRAARRPRPSLRLRPTAS